MNRRRLNQLLLGTTAIISPAGVAAARTMGHGLARAGGAGTTIQTIASITVAGSSSAASFASNTANAVVGPIAVVMSPPSPPFTGTVSLDSGGYNTEGFHLTSAFLPSNLLAPPGGLTAGAYTDVVIRASQGGLSDLTINPVLTASGGVIPNPPQTVGTPFPQQQGGASVFQASVVAGTFTQNAGDVFGASGTITLNAGFRKGGFAGSITMQYYADGVPLFPIVTGAPYAYSLNTNTLSNAPHVITTAIIDTAASSAAYFCNTGTMILLVNNAGGLLSTAPQSTVCFKQPSVSGNFNVGYDRINYSGPNAPNTAFPFVPITGTIPPATADPRYNGAPGSGTDPLLLLHNDSNYYWYIETLVEVTSEEYEAIPEFVTDRTWGGVYQQFRNWQSGGNNYQTQAYDFVVRANPMDGGNLDDSISSYSTFVEHADGTGWLVTDINGRLAKLLWNGTLTTLCGYVRDRTQLTFDMNDPGVPEGSVTRTLIGTFGTGADDLGSLNDVCYDPRDHSGPGGISQILYGAMGLDHLIVKINLGTSPPTISWYAGEQGVSGSCPAAGGSVATGTAGSPVAHFNLPTSLQMTADGSLYIADNLNHAVRVINPAGTTVTTLIRGATEPIDDTVYYNTLQADHDTNPYSPAAPVPFASAYMHYAFCLRLASTGNIVVIGSQDYFIRLINLNGINAGNITRIGKYNMTFATGNAANTASQWQWLDCDITGAVGPVDNIMMVQLGSAGWWRQTFDNTYGAFFVNGSQRRLSEGVSPATVYGGGGHYPWACSFSRTTGRMALNGIGTNNPRIWHIRQVGEPGYDFVDGTAFPYGDLIFRQGSPVDGDTGSFGFSRGTWPWNLKPSFALLRGINCYGHLGGFGSGKNTMSELYSLPDGNPLLHPGDPGNAGTLTEYIQSGLGGIVPRPELTGRDLVNLIYYMRRNCPQGSYPTAVAVGSLPTDFTPPVITNLLATRISSTSIRIQCTTDKPCTGFGMACSATQLPYFNVFSPVESNYGTSHDVTIVNLPAVSPIFYSFQARDLAGNNKYTNNQPLF